MAGCVRWLLLLGALTALACGESSPAGPSAAPSGASQSAVATVSGPRAKAVCSLLSGDDRSCFEYEDDELVREREPSCQGTFAKDSTCPRSDVLGVCRLPDGSLRYGYPPKTLVMHEKACKEVQGAFAAGSAPPPKDPVTTTRCDGKYESACEEEQVHTMARLRASEDECRSFGGHYHVGGKCAREAALAECDLQGKRTIVLAGPANPDARKRFCDERSGALIEIAKPAASASASASAGPAPDEDPPAPKADVVIRRQ